MLDTHNPIVGVHPQIFGIPTYSLFVTLGCLAGLAYYLVSAKRASGQFSQAFTIITAAFVCAWVGSKIPILFLSRDIKTLLISKSIVGALLGGMLGVMVVKRITGIKLRMGNIIAPSAALGIAIGRFGCFFGGCCYGIPAAWGFDFGDGQLRLPTQLFEVAFHSFAFVIMLCIKNRIKTPGMLFKVYVLVYFIFRFFMEFIRETPPLWMGMTIYQIICLSGSAYMLLVILKMKRGGRQHA